MVTSVLRSAKPDRDLATLLAALRQYRLEQNLTYRELGNLVGLTHSRLYDVLNEKGAQVNDRTRYRIDKFAHEVGLRSDRRRVS